MKQVGKAAATAAGVAALQVIAQHSDEIATAVIGVLPVVISPYASIFVTLIALVLNPFKKEGPR